MDGDFLDSLAASSIPARACELWRGDLSSLALRKSHSRLVYRFERGEEGCFLKFAYGVQATPEAVAKCAADIDFVAFLAARGVPVNEPIASRNGKYLETSEWAGQPVRVSVTREAIGETVGSQCTDPSVFRACGAALARLHVAAEHYTAPVPEHVRSWEDEWQQTDSWIPLDEPVLRGEYDQVNSWLTEKAPVPGGTGVTHADCNRENFLINAGTATIIDFDEVADTFFARDIARLMRDFRHQERDVRLSNLHALQEGYDAVRPNSGITTDDVAWLLRMEHLEMYVWFHAHASCPADRNKPYMREWRQHIETPLTW